MLRIELRVAVCQPECDCKLVRNALADPELVPDALPLTVAVRDLVCHALADSELDADVVAVAQQVSDHQPDLVCYAHSDSEPLADSHAVHIGQWHDHAFCSCHPVSDDDSDDLANGYGDVNGDSHCDGLANKHGTGVAICDSEPLKCTLCIGVIIVVVIALSIAQRQRAADSVSVCEQVSEPCAVAVALGVSQRNAVHLCTGDTFCLITASGS